MDENEIILWLDVTDSSSSRWICSIDLPKKEEEFFELAFPRWVPGSYTIREPVRMVRDLRSAPCPDELPWNSPLPLLKSGQNGVERIGLNRLKVKNNPGNNGRVRLTWETIADELSVRTNHSTHLHALVSQPATWLSLIHI